MIVLITPTGGRPNQFNLCAAFMQRQTYPGNVTWVIVDDCLPRTTDFVTESFKENWIIKKVYPVPPWQRGQNSQGRNISAGINEMLRCCRPDEIEGVFIIEDDDYYKPVYLERMKPRIHGFQATGEMNTVYYNVFYRTYFIHPNTGHSSLFQTAFSMEALPIFERCYTERFIDMSFWTMLTRVNLFHDGNLSVGIKGMPGRYGIGSGHTRLRNMPRDADWNFLRSIIGDDARFYERYYGGSGSGQYSLLNRRSF